jgi:hypothetical protein
MLRCRLLLYGVVLFSGAGLATGAGSGDHAPAPCATTRPSNPPFVPPSPYPSNWAESGDFWYGTESLWTLLAVSGAWSVRGNVLEGKGSYRTKLIYWCRGFDSGKEAEPELIVTARRLDRKAATVAADRANAVFVRSEQPAAMMTAIDIPTAGCWQVGAQYRGHTLSFVVSVNP